jgi:hypothetical protein
MLLEILFKTGWRGGRNYPGYPLDKSVAGRRWGGGKVGKGKFIDGERIKGAVRVSLTMRVDGKVFLFVPFRTGTTPFF